MTQSEVQGQDQTPSDRSLTIPLFQLATQTQFLVTLAVASRMEVALKLTAGQVLLLACCLSLQSLVTESKLLTNFRFERFKLQTKSGPERMLAMRVRTMTCQAFA